MFCDFKKLIITSNYFNRKGVSKEMELVGKGFSDEVTEVLLAKVKY